MVVRWYLYIALFLIIQVALPGAYAIDPEPFRRDEIDGRDFRYGDFYFLHQLTYRHRNEWADRWAVNDQGFRITAGSVTSDDLWVDAELNKRIPFDETFLGEIRFRRREDFDSRYDRFLTGVGVRIAPQWEVLLLGDIEGEKESIDLQFELRRRSENNTLFRIAFVAVDYFFDSKNAIGGRYTKDPYTLFAEVEYPFAKRSRVSSWINYNPKLRLEFNDSDAGERLGEEFAYEQLNGGAEVVTELSDRWMMRIAGSFEDAEREFRNSSDRDGGDSYDLNRDHWRARIEFEHFFMPAISWWFGAQHFLLDEQDRDAVEQRENRKLRRRETTLYAGVTAHYTDQLIFWPGLYLNVMDNLDTSDEFAEGGDDNEDLIGKVALPLEYAFSSEAAVTGNVTWKFPDIGFGGYNVQFLVRF